jgi:hypothetical protein
MHSALLKWERKALNLVVLRGFAALSWLKKSVGPCQALDGPLATSSNLFPHWILIVSLLVGSSYYWIIVSSFLKPDPGFLGCRPDSEGSWSIGMYFGKSHLSLSPIELIKSFKSTTDISFNNSINFDWLITYFLICQNSKKIRLI